MRRIAPFGDKLGAREIVASSVPVATAACRVLDRSGNTPRAPAKSSRRKCVYRSIVNVIVECRATMRRLAVPMIGGLGAGFPMELLIYPIIFYVTKRFTLVKNPNQPRLDVHWQPLRLRETEKASMANSVLWAWWEVV
ncbi:MAG TPA: hypothetical protein VHX86_13375 [Tepidisphaeraceae bacterium]|nr:hypothetical protein [Tepidisphaeraceae bacterium]